MPGLPRLFETIVRLHNRSSEHVAVHHSSAFTSLATQEVTTLSCGHSSRMELSIVYDDVKLTTTIKRSWCTSRGRGKASRSRRLKLKDASLSAFACYNEPRKELDVVFLSLPDRSNWMSLLPSHLYLSDLVLPGTHETLAEYGYPISTCQRTQSVAFQLSCGVRFLDLRFALMTSGILRAYHGIQNEKVPAADVFEELYAFLDAHPTETLICSIKQENAVREFQQKILELIDPHLDRWWLENRMPTVAEARGKVVLFSRFGNGANLGIKPDRWPNNSTQSWMWELDGMPVHMQDWYNLGSLLRIPEKFGKVVELLRLPEKPSRPSWRIDFASAATPALGAMPSWVACGFGLSRFGLGIRGVNARLVDWLIRAIIEAEDSTLPPVQCTAILLDFYEIPEDSLLPLLIGMNFWPSNLDVKVVEKV